jgi:phenylacetyl-CoA:acceptor oxidoreductase subunit 2
VSTGPRPWLQQHWDIRAALNFMLGGTGAGLMIVSSLPGREDSYVILVSLGLVAAGLGAVWLEIGRKLRALHVFLNPLTSWMTRESFAALLLFPLGLGAFLAAKLLPAAALAAVAFLYCQARILHGAKGIPAWRAPEVVPLVVLTGLAEGAGALVLFSVQPLVLAVLGIAVVARALAWMRYRAAVRSAALEPAGRSLAWIGSVAVLALAGAGLYVAEAAYLAGLAAIATGWHFKLALVTRAALNQGFALPRLPVRGTR